MRRRSRLRRMAEFSSRCYPGPVERDDTGEVMVAARGPIGSSKRRVRLPARLQILGWSALLLTLSWLASTVVVHVILTRHADQQINADVDHEMVEFAALRTDGNAPTGNGAVTRLLDRATGRAVPEREITLLGIERGRILVASGNTPPSALGLRRSDLARLTQVQGSERGVLQLAGGPARYAAVSVTAPGDNTRGVFVAAVSIEPIYGPVWSTTALQVEVGSAALAAALLLAWIAAGRVLRPIRTTTDLAKRITATDLRERLPVRGRDEVSELAATFNAMLDRLAHAFAAQRRFLADAGHQLRTPITVVQGNLDTLRPRDADDAETLAVVGDELGRMTRLVQDLSLLAASERPDFLRPEVVDLARLGSALTTKVRVMGDRPWTCDCRMTGLAVLDPHRVTEAVLQLADNAAAHTPTGSAVELRCRTIGEQRQADAKADIDVEFAVVDHGPGIPASARRRVLRAFTQLRPNHSGSTGLGLAIVNAITEAHGGRVEISDTPGGGATISLRFHLQQVSIRASTGSWRSTLDDEIDLADSTTTVRSDP